MCRHEYFHLVKNWGLFQIQWRDSNNTTTYFVVGIHVPGRNRTDLIPKNLKHGDSEGRLAALRHTVPIFKITGSLGQVCPEDIHTLKMNSGILGELFLSQLIFFDNSVIFLEAKALHQSRKAPEGCFVH